MGPVSDLPQHVTLTATVKSELTFAGVDLWLVEVTVVAGADPVWFTVNGNEPTVGGQGCHVVAGVAGAFTVASPRRDGAPEDGQTVVKLISAGTPLVSARGL